ncbi:649_t:CDS:2, partial [Funneliformis mosseae]
MTPTKDGNYFVRVTKGLDDLQKVNIGILFNADFNSWSYVRKIFTRVAGSPNALRFAVKMVDNIFQDLEKLWNNLIEEKGQFVNNEQEKSVEIDFVSWSKRIFAETTMLQTARLHPNVLSAYYNRITNRDLDNIQSINEEFLDQHSDQFDEYNIPSSTQLAINIVSLHKNQNYWKEPTKFNPSRFLASSNNDETYNKGTLMNFGGGL